MKTKIFLCKSPKKAKYVGKMAIILPKKVIFLPKMAIFLPKMAIQACDRRGRSKPCDTPDTQWNPVRHPESSTSEASELPEEPAV